MSKFSVMFVSVIFCFNVKAQDSTIFFKKVNVGIVLSSFGVTDFTNKEKPFVLVNNLSPNIMAVTSKTYHNILYGMGNNSLRSINGYFLKNDFDVYVLCLRTLKSKENYLGIGIERMITMGDAKSFLFLEAGSDFKKSKTVSIGLLLSFQNTIWKHK